MNMRYSPRLTRREALGLLGGGAGLGLVSLWRGEADLAAGWLQARPSAVTFPQGAIIRTVLRDIPPGALGTGATLFHEHFSFERSILQTAPPPPGRPPLAGPTKDVALMAAELEKSAQEGLGCVVDAGSPDVGRDLEFLKRLAMQTRVHIVAGGGHYIERLYPRDLATESEDQIAEELTKEAMAKRYGAFGELATSPNAAMTPMEIKIFRAEGKAHLRTNLPILTHNPYGNNAPEVPKDAGLRQLDVLEGVGVRPERIAIGHMCCLDDLTAEVIKQIAKRGAFVGFDRVTGGAVPDDQKVRALLKFLEAGYADRLLLSSDYNFTGERSAARPGYGSTLTVFVPKLRQAGVKDDMIRSITIDNPRRFLAFVPKA